MPIDPPSNWKQLDAHVLGSSSSVTFEVSQHDKDNLLPRLQQLNWQLVESSLPSKVPELVFCHDDKGMLNVSFDTEKLVISFPSTNEIRSCVKPNQTRLIPRTPRFTHPQVEGYITRFYETGAISFKSESTGFGSTGFNQSIYVESSDLINDLAHVFEQQLIEDYWLPIGRSSSFFQVSSDWRRIHQNGERLSGSLKLISVGNNAYLLLANFYRLQ